MTKIQNLKQPLNVRTEDRIMPKLLYTGIVLIISLAQMSCAGNLNTKDGPTDTEHVPGEYRALYGELATNLNRLDKTLNAQWDGKKADVKFGVELLVANANRGEVLLTDRVFKATILTLDRLQDLGVRSVAISIQFPMLTRSFPRFNEYKDFYRRVAEIRRRDFVFIVEIGTFFRETEFTKFKMNYDNLTFDRFNAQLRQMANIIIQDLQPDYLTILTEPDTMQNNTGLKFTAKNFSTTIRHVVRGLQPRGVKLGAGAGTWSPMAYFNALAEISQIDYIDLHIYPVQRDFVWDKVTRIADTAAKRGKRVSIGEAWLYKVSNREFRSINHVEAFARDVFSFWQPLDSLFLEVTAKLSHHVDAEFCSFFWMKHLYAYLDYDAQTRKLHPPQLMHKMDLMAGRNIVQNKPSKTGETFKAITITR
jgi:hypothetical protein